VPHCLSSPAGLLHINNINYKSPTALLTTCHVLASLLQCAGGFILSASLDKSVRLWHLSQPGCLRQFWHTDFVTSVQFHPLDAQRFVSGEVLEATALQQAVACAADGIHLAVSACRTCNLIVGQVECACLMGRSLLKSSVLWVHMLLCYLRCWH
jgi:hypothetical protein